MAQLNFVLCHVLLNVQYAADLSEAQQHLLACGCDFIHFTLLNQIALIGQPFQINSCILKIEVYPKLRLVQ